MYTYIYIYLHVQAFTDVYVHVEIVPIQRMGQKYLLSWRRVRIYIHIYENIYQGLCKHAYV